MKKLTKNIRFKMSKVTKKYFDKMNDKIALKTLTTPWVGEKLLVKKLKK